MKINNKLMKMLFIFIEYAFLQNDFCVALIVAMA